MLELFWRTIRKFINSGLMFFKVSFSWISPFAGPGHRPRNPFFPQRKLAKDLSENQL
jgi:hypothetical protein